jgi:flagellar motor protein MotB
MTKKLLFVTIGFALLGLTGCTPGQEVEDPELVLDAKLQQCIADKEVLQSDLQSARDQISTLTDQLTDAQADARQYSELAQQLREAKQKLEREKQAIAGVVEDMEWLVNLEERGGETVMVMENEILFPSGSHELTDDAKRGLNQLAGRLAEVPNATIRIDGHTDGEPIRASADKYSSNWDLAAERAESVRAYLAENGLDSSRTFIAGFGPTVPRVEPPAPDAAVPENRRVEILLLFDQKADMETLLDSVDVE